MGNRGGGRGTCQDPISGLKDYLPLLLTPCRLTSRGARAQALAGFPTGTRQPADALADFCPHASIGTRHRHPTSRPSLLYAHHVLKLAGFPPPPPVTRQSITAFADFCPHPFTGSINMVRACLAQRQLLQNHPSGHLGSGDAVVGKELLDGRYHRADIPAQGRTARDRLPQKRLEADLC